MSYPCVFEYNGAYYMIPETLANQSVDLYRATKFPHLWEKVKTLISGERYVDTTVLNINGRCYAVSYRNTKGGWLLDYFALDMEKYDMQYLKSVQYASNVGRPAGNFIEDGILLRPAQNCTDKYGENLIFYRVKRSDHGTYGECEAEKVKASQIVMDGRPNRVHTYNRDSLYECVDVYFERLDSLHGIKTLWRAYLRKYIICHEKQCDGQ